MSTTRLFVYYKVPATDLAAVCQAVRLMQLRLRARHAGLQAELLRRPDAPQGVVTLMETYAAPQGVDEDLQANIQLAADDLARWPIGARHVELFIAP